MHACRSTLEDPTIAKNVYVDTRSGWFSCRTACYLAAGRPAVVQDTTWSRYVPSGKGLIAFTTMDEAIDGLLRVSREPEKHRISAYEIAREHLAPDRVLPHMIDEIFAGKPPSSGTPGEGRGEGSSPSIANRKSQILKTPSPAFPRSTGGGDQARAMNKPLTILVGGYIVGFPLGGMTWHHLNYLLGLHEMGHEVWFLEDSGDYSQPYNPTTWTCGIDSSYGRAYLESTFKQYGLPLRYCYYSQFEDQYYGLSRDELQVLMKRADLLLCVSGVTPMRSERPRPRRCAVIDTDPVFTQLRMRDNEVFLNYYKQFDAAATFGRLIGTPDCPLPTHGFNWIPTHQPIALRHWPVVPATSKSFTTIGKWEHTSERHLEFAGKRYLSSKGVEWMKMLNLPLHARVPLTLGMQKMPSDVAERFRGHGWNIVDPEQASLSCAAFQKFIQDSAGEFTVAKEIYAALPSGWFSDRSAAYLASGRPVVTQASGFDQWLPTGEGLFSFNDVDQAASSLNTIAADYPRHALAARRIAEEYFDSRKVLSDLLDRIL